MKTDGAHNRHLPSRIQPFDIGWRVGFGIAKLCCLRQRFIKFHAFLIHLCEDVVGCSIDDSHNLCNVIGHKTLLQRPDNRNTAGTGCLKHKIHIIFFRCIQQFSSMNCNKIFIGRHNTLSRIQTTADKGSGRFDPAHNFNNDLNTVIIYNIFKILCQ